MSREEGEVRVEGAALASPVVDTTGAGDAFVGSLAYFLARRPGMALQEMVSHVLHTNRNTNQLTISLPTNQSFNQRVNQPTSLGPTPCAPRCAARAPWPP